MTLERLIPTTINYSDLVKDTPTIRKTLRILQFYLCDESSFLPKLQRDNHVRYIFNEMINVGKIVEGSEWYKLMNKFYQNNFEEPAPCFINYDVLLVKEYEDSMSV